MRSSLCIAATSVTLLCLPRRHKLLLILNVAVWDQIPWQPDRVSKADEA